MTPYLLKNPNVFHDGKNKKKVVGCETENGFIYSGSVTCLEDGSCLPDGSGNLCLKNGNKLYDGGFSKGVYDSRGLLNLPNNRRYLGDFSKGAFEGEGQLLFRNDDLYVGLFSKNKFINGSLFITKKSQLHGTKRLLIYKGAWLDYKKHGKGTLYLENGQRITTEFANDQMVDGKGQIEYISGEKYEGDLVKGKREGIGTYISGTERYTGEWKSDCFHGQGIYTSTITDPNKTVVTEYSGTWDRHLESGRFSIAQKIYDKSTKDLLEILRWSEIWENNQRSQATEKLSLDIRHVSAWLKTIVHPQTSGPILDKSINWDEISTRVKDETTQEWPSPERNPRDLSPQRHQTADPSTKQKR